MTKKQQPGLQVKAGRFVIAYPIEYRVSMSYNDPDIVGLHLARQMFDNRAEIVGLNDEMYAEAIAMLENVCIDADREFVISDPVEMVCKIDGESKYVRIVDARKCEQC